MFYPFAHAAFFLPFNTFASDSKGGWYLGLGAGYLKSEYSFPEGPAPLDLGIMDFITGFNILDMIDISYTFRTNFKGANNMKFAIGYVYRFSGQ